MNKVIRVPPLSSLKSYLARTIYEFDLMKLKKSISFSLRSIHFKNKITSISYNIIRKNKELAAFYITLRTSKCRIRNLYFGHTSTDTFSDQTSSGLSLSGYFLSILATTVGERFQCLLQLDAILTKSIYKKFFFTAADKLSRRDVSLANIPLMYTRIFRREGYLPTFFKIE